MEGVLFRLREANKKLGVVPLSPLLKTLKEVNSILQ
jgi:hypothetical protein